MVDQPEATAEAGKAINPWAAGPDRNPYLHNVFAMLGLDPDEGGTALEERCEKLLLQIETQDLKIYGRKVEKTDVTRALDLARNAAQYAAERLLAHTAHPLELKPFQAPMQAIDRLKFPKPEEVVPLPINDLSCLLGLLPRPAEIAGGEPTPIAKETLLDLIQPNDGAERIHDE
jgi:hypothetical protein